MASQTTIVYNAERHIITTSSTIAIKDTWKYAGSDVTTLEMNESICLHKEALSRFDGSLEVWLQSGSAPKHKLNG